MKAKLVSAQFHSDGSIRKVQPGLVYTLVYGPWKINFAAALGMDCFCHS